MEDAVAVEHSESYTPQLRCIPNISATAASVCSVDSNDTVGSVSSLDSHAAVASVRDVEIATGNSVAYDCSQQRGTHVLVNMHTNANAVLRSASFPGIAFGVFSVYYCPARPEHVSRLPRMYAAAPDNAIETE